MAYQKTKLYLLQYTNYRAPEKYATPYAEHQMEHMKTDVVLLGEIELNIDYPEIDTRKAQIDALEAELFKVRSAAQASVNLLNERISKLRAIGCDADGVPV